MNITPPPDDDGTLRLRHSTGHAGTVRPSAEIAPTGAVTEEAQGAERRAVERPLPRAPATAYPPTEEDSSWSGPDRRSGEDRRQADRRQNRKKILLDTRVPQERRRQRRRPEDRGDTASSRPGITGIDLVVG